MPEAKPHCGPIATCPTSMNRPASSIRAIRSSACSTAPVLVVMRPRTTVGPSFGHEAQRLETAGALGIVFQQQPVELQVAEEIFRNAVIGALAVPHGGPVAAADMQAEAGLAPMAFDRGVRGFDGVPEIVNRVLAARRHALQRRPVDIAGVARLIELDIGASGVDDLADHPVLDRRDIVEEGLTVGVVGRRVFDIAHLGDPVRPHQHDLCRRSGQSFQKPVFRQRGVAFQGQLSGRRRLEMLDRIRAAPARLFAFHQIVRAGHEGPPRAFPLVPALDLGKADLPVQPAILAVADDRQPQGFLLRDDIADCVVLRSGQYLLVDLPPAARQKGVDQRARPQQAADMIDAKVLHPGVHTVIPGPVRRRSDGVAARRYGGNPSPVCRESSWWDAHSLASASIPALSLCAASTKTFFLL